MPLHKARPKIGSKKMTITGHLKLLDAFSLEVLSVDEKNAEATLRVKVGDETKLIYAKVEDLYNFALNVVFEK